MTTFNQYNFSALQAIDSLYNLKDHVTILETSNFTKFVINQHQDGKKIQLIQFYSSYCGHCISFAPQFKRFLKSVDKWSDLLSISVVNCADDINRKVCSDYKVEYFPTLRMFWFKPNEKDKGNKLDLIGRSVDEIRDSVLKWITDYWKHGNFNYDWPQFEPMNAESKEKLIEKLKFDHDNRTRVFVVEKDSSFLGREIMMDLSRYRSQVAIYRITESEIRLLDQILYPQTLDGFKLPFLMAIDAKERQFKVLSSRILSKKNDRQHFIETIKNEFIKNVQPELSENESVEVTAKENLVIKYSNRIFTSDLNNAIRYALFHEVPMIKNLNVDQTNALIRFLGVIKDDFHFQNEKTRKFIEYLYDWLGKKLNDSKRRALSVLPAIVVSSDDLLTTMKMYEDYYHFPEMKPWQACAGFVGSSFRSYPCSLWTLFHMLTISEYRRSIATKQWQSLHASLYAMREYIRHFFRCTECARHFVTMAYDLENELTHPNSSVLWLWQAHNQVNARLKGSPSEIAQLPKRQFPTHSECGHCYRSVPNETYFTDSLHYRKYYDESKVLQFLVEYYSVERMVADNSEFEDSKKKIEIHHNQPFITSPPIEEKKKPREIKKNIIQLVPFTSADYSIIIFFYVASITLLLTLCAFFKLRKRRKNRKQSPLLP